MQTQVYQVSSVYPPCSAQLSPTPEPYTVHPLDAVAIHPPATKQKEVEYSLRSSWRGSADETCHFISIAPWDERLLTKHNIEREAKDGWHGKWVDFIKQWEGVMAVVQSSTITFIRLKADSAHEVLLKIPNSASKGTNNAFHTLAWTIDQQRLVPIVAMAGKSEVHIWRLGWNPTAKKVYATRLRILRGHTDEVRVLKFHPESGHILASGSQDGTVRIWNIFGAGSPTEGAQETKPEVGGKVEVAVLSETRPASQGNAAVTALDFSPTKQPYIVTGDGTGAVKVWALPMLPKMHEPVQTSLVAGRIGAPVSSDHDNSRGSVDGLSWQDAIICYSATPHSKVTVFRWESPEVQETLSSHHKTRTVSVDKVDGGRAGSNGPRRPMKRKACGSDVEGALHEAKRHHDVTPPLSSSLFRIHEFTPPTLDVPAPLGSSCSDFQAGHGTDGLFVIPSPGGRGGLAVYVTDPATQSIDLDRASSKYPPTVSLTRNLAVPTESNLMTLSQTRNEDGSRDTASDARVGSPSFKRVDLDVRDGWGDRSQFKSVSVRGIWVGAVDKGRVWIWQRR